MSESANQLYNSPGMISAVMPQGVTARENMMFQEYLSNTAIQRQMADARAAGLNPWLMNIGQGASTPSGSIDSAELLSALLGNSSRGSAKAKEEEFGWTQVFGALGLKKSQAEYAGSICDALGVSPQQVVDGVIRYGGNVWKYFQEVYKKKTESRGSVWKSDGEFSGRSGAFGPHTWRYAFSEV